MEVEPHSPRVILYVLGLVPQNSTLASMELPKTSVDNMVMPLGLPTNIKSLPVMPRSSKSEFVVSVILLMRGIRPKPIFTPDGGAMLIIWHSPCGIVVVLVVLPSVQLR